uniref:Uncharacterized protein n=1 Tax=Romanomermis culicivorax TaxID=13658 RepID=A0A915I619_ROMCU
MDGKHNERNENRIVSENYFISLSKMVGHGTREFSSGEIKIRYTVARSYQFGNTTYSQLPPGSTWAVKGYEENCG